MTRITRLVMKGFKSFANKTEIPFGEKFNCVLGPNGSGKSNILDAICFVLGKASAKGLRVEKSSNLIYNGGKKKNPAKSAEVSIYFDNSRKIFPEETGEVKLSRIIKATGQSDYKINDKKRTRQQILEMMSIAKINPDGYNITLQGDITQFVEMTPLQKRGIIEEISGISIYEEKKEKALRDLNRVEEKINEADIVLAERRSFLSELKKERDQAQKYKNLNDKVKSNQATLLDHQIKEKNKALSKSEKESSEQKTQLTKIQDQKENLKKEIENNKKDINKINKEVEQKGEKEQVALHKEIEAIKVDLALNKQRVDTVKGEIRKIEERIGDLKETKNEIQNRIDILVSNNKEVSERLTQKEGDIKKIDIRIKEFNKKHSVSDAQEIDKKIEEIDKQAEKLQNDLNSLREKQQNLLREKDRLDLKIEGVDEKINKVLSIEKENQESVVKLKNMKNEFKKSTLELNQALAKDASLAQQLSTAQGKFISAKEELAKLKAESASIKTQLSAGDAIEKILSLKKAGVYGTVSSLGSVKKEYTLALEVAAGNRIKSIVVDNDRIAAECIKYLKEKRLGVATFLPLNKLKTPLIKTEYRNSKKKGVVGLALDLVSYDKRFEKAFKYVFENTIVVESVDDARRIGIGTERMITLSGDLVERSGAMQGGFRARRRGLGFQEKELTGDIEKLEKKIKDNEKLMSRLEKERGQNQANIDKLRELKANLEADIIKLEKILHIDSEDIDLNKDEKSKIKAELKKISKDLDNTINDISDKNKELGGLKTEKQGLRDKIAAMRNPTVLAEINSFEEKRAELKEEVSELSAGIKNNETQINNIFSVEKEKIGKIVKQHEKEKEGFSKEIGGLDGIIKKQEKSLKDKESAEKEFYTQFKELFTKRDKLNNNISRLEGTMSAKDEEARGVEIKINGLSIENARIKAEMSGLQEEFKDYEGVELFEGKSITQIKAEITQFKNMLEDFGAVNMRALEIYDSVEKEYDSLQKKKEMLSVERGDVLSMINEIDSKKGDLFMKTYNVINENFQTIFSKMTTKGEASLALDDPNDPFNGGMTIKVRISGKKFLDIRSLSGGEKTLTALAFIFSVQEHEPASFYVLDEVDAALDKHNSEKLALLIESYASRAQYIMISHNDTIISNAEMLYGVSMNEFGVSKVTSLKI